MRTSRGIDRVLTGGRVFFAVFPNYLGYVGIAAFWAGYPRCFRMYSNFLTYR